MSEIIDEDQAFADLIATIIDRRRKQGLALILDWIAAEATHELDPNRISHPVIYEACRLHLRHIASGKVCTEIEEDPLGVRISSFAGL